MKFAVVSDIHNRDFFSGEEPPPYREAPFYDNFSFHKLPASDKKELESCDFVLVAGDTAGCKRCSDFWLRRFGEELREINPKIQLRSVPGNHEFYRDKNELFDEKQRLLQVYQGFNYCLSDKTYLAVQKDVRKHEFPLKHEEGPFPSLTKEELGENIVLVSTTLWTPVRKKKSQGLSDFFYIKRFNKDFGGSPSAYSELYKKNRDSLLEAVKEAKEQGKKVVILTHHVPLAKFSDFDDPEVDHDYDECFCVLNKKDNKAFLDLKAEVWVFGHTHRFIREKVGETLFLCNPRGYFSERVYGNYSFETFEI